MTHSDNAIESKTKQATQWLQQIAQETETGGDATKLLKALREPPEFLPVDCAETLENLRETQQSRIDTNEIDALSRRFRKLSRTKREECLVVLQTLLDEETE